MRQFIRKLADHKPVNGFDYVREAVRENPSMTPEDIRSRRFGRQLLGGLNPEQVSAFLEDVADAFETVQRVSAKTETYMRMLQDELETVAARRATLLPRDAFEADEPRATSIIPDGEQQDEAAASRISRSRSRMSGSIFSAEAISAHHRSMHRRSRAMIMTPLKVMMNAVCPGSRADRQMAHLSVPPSRV